MTDTIVFDVDGTLVDTNYHHALAWFRAFRDHDVTVPVWKIHRAIGMGGDRLVAHVAGDDVEKALGDVVRKSWKREFAPMLDEVVPFEGAREVLEDTRRLGRQLVLASSGNPEHVRRYRELLGADELVERTTDAEDVSDSKPDPDLFEAALQGLAEGRAVVIGDSVWDCEAAKCVGLPCVGLLTGGSGADELRSAGAVRVYSSLEELRTDLPDLPMEPVRLDR